MPDSAQTTPLPLRVERALLVQRQLRSLLLDADAALTGLRRELRNHKARLARAAQAIPGSPVKGRHS